MLCQTANFTVRKFHTVKSWYQFLTAREKLVPILHAFQTNISHIEKNVHVVKLYEAYMRVLQIFRIHPICCILHSIPILHMHGIIL